MIWKAMALMCILENGETTCPTVFFDESFTSKRQCEAWLVEKRIFKLSRNKKIVLDDCYQQAYIEE